MSDSEEPYKPYRRGTILVPDHRKEHLFVILTDACNNGLHIIANVSSIEGKRRVDETCIIEAGAHPFITAKSFVEYRFADVKHGRDITNMVRRRYYRVHADASEELTQKIFDGLSKSEMTRNFVLNYLDALRL